MRSLYAWSGAEIAHKLLWNGIQVLGRCPSWGGQVDPFPDCWRHEPEGRDRLESECPRSKPRAGQQTRKEGTEAPRLRQQHGGGFQIRAGALVCNLIFRVLALCARPRRGLPPDIAEHLRLTLGFRTAAQPILVARPGKSQGNDWSLTVRVRGEEGECEEQVKSMSSDCKPQVSPERASPLRDFLKRFNPKGEWKRLYLCRLSWSDTKKERALQ